MFADCLKALRKERKVSQSMLAGALGLTQQAVGKWETGRSTPDPQTLALLASYFDVSTDSLLGISYAPMEAMEVLPYEASGQHLVPVIGTVRAGFGALAFEEDYGEEYANVKDPCNYFYLIVKGDSMEPRISDGDLALIRRQPALDSGDLGVVVYGDGSGTLKKFIRRGNSIVLQPFNPDYQAQIIMGEDLQDLHIVGKLVETKRKW